MRGVTPFEERQDLRVVERELLEQRRHGGLPPLRVLVRVDGSPCAPEMISA